MNQLDLFPTELHLRRIDPSRNMRRFYGLSVQRNLFGEWVLLREWGRIGYRGRSKEDPFPDPGPAHDALNRLARRKLRRGYLAVIYSRRGQRSNQSGRLGWG